MINNGENCSIIDGITNIYINNCVTGNESE